MHARFRHVHRRRSSAAARQRGAALILLITVLVIGVVWYTVGALGKAAPTTAGRDSISGAALGQAKQALLAYVAQYAARGSTLEPGQMPCPESVNAIGTSNQGQASSNCGNSTAVGRLPWETLGVDEVRDGYGEPIWYVLSPGFRSAPINFETSAQLTYNGNPNAAVALLIAPGPALNTLADPATPPAGCSKVDQQVSTRNTASLNPANFLECGNESGSANYAAPGPSEWTNDRVVAITAAEWAQAIAGPVADRLQRQVAPALNDWRSNESVANWGYSFLPYASTFSKQTANDLCGNFGYTEGIMPTAGSSSTSCTGWSGGSVLPISGSIGWASCGTSGSSYQCSFWNYGSWGSTVVRIRATAPNVGQSFRAPIAPGNISNNAGGSIVGGSYSLALSTWNGSALLDFQVSFPWWSSGWTTVTFPQLPDAAILSDSRLAWFVNNEWSRDTYYALAPAAKLNPSSACALAGDPGCLTLNGMPAANGNTNDKRLIVALMGPNAVPGQTQPSNSASDYLESRINSTTYASALVTSSFNDRLAACPFQQTPASGGPIAICN